MNSPNVQVNPKGALRVQSGHPWIFRSDVVKTSGAEPGDIVPVFSHKDRFLGQAFFNPRSQITLRLLTRTRESTTKDFWKKRLVESIERRKPLQSEALRLVFGEADFLPSLILDKYKNILVFQTLSAGMDRLKDQMIGLFEELLHPDGIVERNDPQVRDLEGIPRQKGFVRGGLPEALWVRSGGFFFLVDPLQGQKTGLFIDQQENQSAAARYAKGRILDLFCYQGGFALPLSGAADEILAVDTSAPALQILRQNCERNGLSNIRGVEANGFDFLRDCQDRRERFNTVILDPPPFVRDRKSLTGALRGYKEINLRAMKILEPGGILVTCSCSQNFSEARFYEMLLEAARDSRREIQVLERRGASADHPVLLTFPESCYLQCWILRVI